MSGAVWVEEDGDDHASEIAVDRCEFVDCIRHVFRDDDDDGEHHPNPTGFLGRRISGVSFVSCTFHNILDVSGGRYSYGIYLANCSDIEVRNCTFATDRVGLLCGGIQLVSFGGPNVGARITGCSFEAASNELVSVVDLTFIGNRVRNGTTELPGSGFSITGNQFHATDELKLPLLFNNDETVENATIDDNLFVSARLSIPGNEAIRLEKGCSELRVSGNLFHGHRYQIRIDSPASFSTVQLKDNVHIADADMLVGLYLGGDGQIDSEGNVAIGNAHLPHQARLVEILNGANAVVNPSATNPNTIIGPNMKELQE